MSTKRICTIQRKGKGSSPILNIRGIIQTNDVFSVMNYERNQPSFSMKFKTENRGLYADKTLTLILPDLFIIQCGLNYKK